MKSQGDMLHGWVATQARLIIHNLLRILLGKSLKISVVVTTTKNSKKLQQKKQVEITISNKYSQLASQPWLPRPSPGPSSFFCSCVFPGINYSRSFHVYLFYVKFIYLLIHSSLEDSCVFSPFESSQLGRCFCSNPSCLFEPCCPRGFAEPSFRHSNHLVCASYLSKIGITKDNMVQTKQSFSKFSQK